MRRWVGLLAGVGAATVISAGATSGVGSQPSLLAAQTSGSGFDVEQTYTEQCAPCHGADGEGGVGPDFAGSLLPEAERLTIIAEGGQAMPGFRLTLSSTEIEALSSLVADLAGGAVYAEQCAPCHGIDGEGGVGPSLQAGGWSEEELNEVIANGAARMPAFAPTLNAEQLTAVADYVTKIGEAGPGSQIYAQQCAPCHGEAGEGGIGPSLPGPGQPEEVFQIVEQGSGAMPGFGLTLSDAEINAVVLYMASLAGEAGQGGGGPFTASPTYSAQCASCHGANAEGGAGPALVPTALSQDQLVAVITNGEGGMPGFGGSLSAAEISALAAELGGQEAVGPGPAAGLYAQNCALCHGSAGEGGSGPAVTSLSLSQEELVAVITNGEGGMPGFGGSLSSGDISALAAYLLGGDVAAPADTPDEPEPIAVLPSGAALFAAHCSHCHGSDGTGDTGPDLRRTDLSVNELISRVYGGHNGGMPAFEGQLTGLEVQAVARFVADLHAGFEEEQNSRGGLWAILISLAVVAAFAIGTVIALRRGKATETTVGTGET